MPTELWKKNYRNFKQKEILKGDSYSKLKQKFMICPRQFHGKFYLPGVTVVVENVVVVVVAVRRDAFKSVELKEPFIFQKYLLVVDAVGDAALNENEAVKTIVTAACFFTYL